MAQDIVSGLFGLSPFQVEQQQRQAINQQAAQFAQMPAVQRGVMGMYQGGAGLANIGAGMLGLANPEVEQAKAREAAMSGLDISSPEAIMQRAQQIQDPRMKMQLQMLAQQKMAERQRMAMEAKKIEREDFRMGEEFEWKKEQKRMELEQRAEAARMRSEDIRLGIEQRRQAAAESAALRRELAMMRQGQQTQEKPMTPAQRIKLQKDMSESSQALRGVSDAYFDAANKAEALKNHPGLGGATGVRGMFPSMPGGASAQADTLLEEFKAMTKNAGLQLVRQGGSIGQMTEKEWPIVEAMVANIDPVKLGKEETKHQIDKVVAKMEQVFRNAERQHQEQFGEYMQPATPPAPATPTTASSPAKPKVVDFGSL